MNEGGRPETKGERAQLSVSGRTNLTVRCFFFSVIPNGVIRSEGSRSEAGILFLCSPLTRACPAPLCGGSWRGWVRWLPVSGRDSSVVVGLLFRNDGESMA